MAAYTVSGSGDLVGMGVAHLPSTGMDIERRPCRLEAYVGLEEVC